MKIVVIGGTGLIGSKLVTKLSALGYEVVAASPSSGIDTITGEGLASALENAQVVVDLTNPKSFEEKAVTDFFRISGKNLLAAEKLAGVSHHVTLSVVGTDRPDSNAYFRAKLIQEKLVEESGIPYSILRSTQFFEFVGSIAEAVVIDHKVHASPALFQPIASDDLVSFLTKITLGSPLNAITEVAGPEKIGLDEIIKKYFKLKNDEREVISDPHAPYFGGEITDKSLTPGTNPYLGPTRYDEWIVVPGNLK